MTVDLMPFPEIYDQTAIQEAASQGLQSMEHLIRAFSQKHNNNNVDYSQITDHTVTKFKTVISLLNSTGHARFRRGPVQKNQSDQIVKIESPPSSIFPPSRFVPSNQQSVTLDFTKPMRYDPKIAEENVAVSINSSYISSASAITGDRSVSKGSSIFLATAPSQIVISSGKPPLASRPNRKRCLDHEHSKKFSGKISGAGNGKCHCRKSRKIRMKRTVRVAATSSKTVADIPPDEYSWRKYGQKPIKGSPHPRGYYRCSIFKECSARKHVERALDDPTMLIVTYEGEHRHNLSATQENIASSA
ncbi:unnamed protein product [Cochlearia groenlandica]